MAFSFMVLFFCRVKITPGERSMAPKRNISIRNLIRMVQLAGGVVSMELSLKGENRFRNLKTVFKIFKTN